MCVRNSQKYRGKQSKFHVWASNCFLPGKYCLSLFEKAILTFVSSCHFPRCGNAMFLFETFFVCSLIQFWNWIKNRPGSLTLLLAREFSSNRKFMMLSLLTFTIFNFLIAISLEVLFFKKNLVCFQKWSRLQIVPFPSVCRAWHEKWSRESGLKFLGRVVQSPIKLIQG